MIYLTFATETEARAALFDGEQPRYPALEILAPCPMPVCTTSGQVDTEGQPILAPVPGYHVNCVGECPEALAQWRMYPVTPFAVLAV